MRENLPKHGIGFSLLAAVILLAPVAILGQASESAGEKPRYTKTTYTYKVVDDHEMAISHGMIPVM